MFLEQEGLPNFTREFISYATPQMISPLAFLSKRVKTHGCLTIKFFSWYTILQLPRKFLNHYFPVFTWPDLFSDTRKLFKFFLLFFKAIQIFITGYANISILSYISHCRGFNSAGYIYYAESQTSFNISPYIDILCVKLSVAAFGSCKTYSGL